MSEMIYNSGNQAYDRCAYEPNPLKRKMCEAKKLTRAISSRTHKAAGYEISRKVKGSAGCGCGGKK